VIFLNWDSMGKNTFSCMHHKGILNADKFFKHTGKYRYLPIFSMIFRKKLPKIELWGIWEESTPWNTSGD